jgi:hypothetical protein
LQELKNGTQPLLEGDCQIDGWGQKYIGIGQIKLIRIKRYAEDEEEDSDVIEARAVSGAMADQVISRNQILPKNESLKGLSREEQLARYEVTIQAWPEEKDSLGCTILSWAFAILAVGALVWLYGVLKRWIGQFF